MLLEQINSVHISADWSSRVWELPAFLIEWVVVRSAKFCYGLLALLAIAYLPRANLPPPHTHPIPNPSNTYAPCATWLERAATERPWLPGWRNG